MLYDAIFNQVDDVMHNHNTMCSVGLGPQADQSGWTMSTALVQNQG